MEESFANHAEKTSQSSQTGKRIPLGMSSFGEAERNEFGERMRLAMACIEGSNKPGKGKAMPSEASAIRQRLATLSQDIASHHADLLELLVRFDDLQGWKSAGATHCVAWMNLELGIHMKLGWEYLRVGRELRTLPITTSLFRAGKLSWSKVRHISRVADKNSEKTLCHAALDASASDVEHLCLMYRWKDEYKDGDNGENGRSLRQWESRSLSHSTISNGSTLIRLSLPPELAQAFLNSIEHSLSRLEESDCTLSQRRADAALLMAEASLQSAGRDIATADRYQVIVSVDAAELKKGSTVSPSDTPFKEQSATHGNLSPDTPPTSDTHVKGNTSNTSNTQTSTRKSDDRSAPGITPIPPKRPTLRGAGPIAQETARRIACDCSITTNTMSGGEPTDIGRKSRIWPAGMARAIRDRDQHCQHPGCSQTRNLEIHHIHHWADGGTTCVENGIAMCSRHHHVVHEGGYTIQRVDNNVQRLDEQFVQQRHDDDITQFHFERQLRSDRHSFEKVRQLLPTRYRFRVVDKEGRDILTTREASQVRHSTSVESDDEKSSTYDENNSTPVERAEHIERTGPIRHSFANRHSTSADEHSTHVEYSEATEHSIHAKHSTHVECAESPASYDVEVNTHYPCHYRHRNIAISQPLTAFQ